MGDNLTSAGPPVALEIRPQTLPTPPRSRSRSRQMSVNASSAASTSIAVGGQRARSSAALDVAALVALRRSDAAIAATKPAALRRYYANQARLLDFYARVAEERAAAAERSASSAARGAEVVAAGAPAGAAAAGADGVAVAASAGADVLAVTATAGARADAAAAASSAGAERTSRLVAFALNLSLAANVALLAVKIYAAATSSSLAVVASTVDSVMDLVSGFVVWAASALAARREPSRFPVGRARYEPIGIVVFAALMGAASLQLLSQAVQELAAGLLPGGAGATEVRAGPSTLAVLGAVVVVKAGLFLFCTSLRSASTSVGALALDHFADVLTNAAPLAALLVIARVPAAWPLDAAVTIAMSVYMLSVWGAAAHAQVLLLVGRAATARELGEVTFLALTHSPAITAVDTVIAYQLGNKLWVELDVVMPRATPLAESHDVCEALQLDVERLLDNVERCFVHCDFEFEHRRATEHIAPWEQTAYAPDDD